VAGWSRVKPDRRHPIATRSPDRGHGSRVGAWILDRVFFFFLAVTLAAIAVLVGAIDISPAAGDQMAAGGPRISSRFRC